MKPFFPAYHLPLVLLPGPQSFKMTLPVFFFSFLVGSHISLNATFIPVSSLAYFGFSI